MPDINHGLWDRQASVDINKLYVQEERDSARALSLADVLADELSVEVVRANLSPRSVYTFDARRAKKLTVTSGVKMHGAEEFLVSSGTGLEMYSRFSMVLLAK